ncbi:hypothetical protein LOK49_LG03G03353 [Camellia lanceoleosa]|uniref:Uncharacterized protein n=1 Tax=Camellia lanceoleosa TaxID=1840588 RepID=A0ACC0I911_9ERIC|nr:hypothetical protein LOK49_LG03G03353 [Camellia lanceoleosa]
MASSRRSGPVFAKDDAPLIRERKGELIGCSTFDSGQLLDVKQVTDDHICLVANAGCRVKDLAHIEEHMKAFKAKGGDVSWHIHDEKSLLALQVKNTLLRDKTDNHSQLK